MKIKIAYKLRLKQIRRAFQQRPNKLLFEHIPKCGGSTVRNYLRSQYPMGGTYAVYPPNRADKISRFKCLPERKRFSYDLVIGHGAHHLRDFVHPETLKTTVLRDPIDRIISHYYYVLRTPKHYLYEKVTGDRLSLKDYVTSALSGELRNNYISRFLQIPAVKAEENAEKSIERAFKLIQNEYAVVGILDRLDSAMNAVAQSAHFHDRFQPDRLNVTINRPKLVDVDQTTRHIIEAVNYLDVSLYKLIEKDCSREFNLRVRGILLWVLHA